MLVCAMPRGAFLVYRVCVFGSLIAVVGYGLAHAVSVVELDGRNHWQFLSEWAGTIGALIDSAIGQLLEAPFKVFANVIMSQGVSWGLWGPLGGALALVLSAAHFSIRLDALSFTKTQETEFLTSKEERSERSLHRSSGWPRVLRCGGLGTVAWRQWHFARRHWGSISVGLGVPAALGIAAAFGSG